MSKISTEKPKAPVSRFTKAKNFATDTDIKVGIEAKPEPIAQQSEKKKSLKRINFEADVDLDRELEQFLSKSIRFRKKRTFLTQCLIDGLKKYEGQ